MSWPCPNNSIIPARASTTIGMGRTSHGTTVPGDSTDNASIAASLSARQRDNRTSAGSCEQSATEALIAVPTEPSIRDCVVVKVSGSAAAILARPNTKARCATWCRIVHPHRRGRQGPFRIRWFRHQAVDFRRVRVKSLDHARGHDHTCFLAVMVPSSLPDSGEFSGRTVATSRRPADRAAVNDAHDVSSTNAVGDSDAAATSAGWTR